MLRSSWSRGQTEPLAAIFAVSIFAMALTMYAVAAQPILPGFSDETTADQTIELVWDDIEDDGIFHAHDAADEIGDHVTNDALPAGATVYVTVSAIDEGEETPVAEAGFPAGYPAETTTADVDELERYVADEGTPDDASVATRSIPVAVVSGADIRSGTLRVTVW